MAKVARLANGRFPPGVSGNPVGPYYSRKRRHDQLMRLHAADLGGLTALTQADRLWLSRACDLLMTKPYNAEDKIRFLNTAARLIDGIRERQLKRKRRAAASPLDALTLVGANDAGAQ